MSALRGVRALHREALVGLGVGLVCGMIWRYGFHLPHRNRIDNYYDELAKEQSYQIAVQRRVTLGAVAKFPEGSKPYSTGIGASYKKTEE